MEDLHTLGKRPVEQLREMWRWYKRVRGNLDHRFRRRNASGGGGSGSQRLAYCKTDAPDADEIVCYIDSDSGEEDDEITVRCLIHNGSSLMYADPLLVDGAEIIVHKIDDEWIAEGFEGAEFQS